MYCANNPIRLVDPDGREIWINYNDDDGQNQSILYTAGMNYEGSNEFISKTISYLNAINDNGGSNMLGELISSSNAFNLVNKLAIDKKGNVVQDGLTFSANESGGGDIYAGALLSKGRSEYSNIESISHELFHGLQNEEKQGGGSVFNEVEANVFSGVIATNWMTKTDYFGSLSINGLGNETEKGRAYQQSFLVLMSGFSEKDFNNAVNNFKGGSVKNQTGIYNNYQLIRSNQKKSILQKYYPK